MAISKVILNGTTLMDVTQDTVASSNLLTGYTAHGADGDALTGEYAVPSGTINILQNGVVDVTSYASANVNVSGGGTVEEKDVNFYDYDGTLVDSYTKTEFAALTAMPSNPSHTGLTAQGWNWSLSDAKTYVNTYGKLDIGQMYITDDGKTRIYIRLYEGRLSPNLGFAINGTAIVDWGDGSSTSTVTGTSTSTVIYTIHNYSLPGDYVISISVTGTLTLKGGGTYGSQVLSNGASGATANICYNSGIIKVEIGSNTTISDYAFYYCTKLVSITLPNTLSAISGYAFYYCQSLAAVIFPSSIYTISTYIMSSCYSLSVVSIPNTVTTIKTQSFSSSGITSIKIPSSVTSIETYMCESCTRLKEIIIPNSVTQIAASVFNSSVSLNSVIFSQNISAISNYTFQACRSLDSFIIPDNVTSLGSGAFASCFGMKSVTLSSNLTSIAASCFNKNYGLGKIVFKSQTPPTVANSNAWGSLPTDCKIYVPSGSLSSYTSASNYPSSSTYTYIEY